jgi:GNAT superfamily N-acetyltransferase
VRIEPVDVEAADEAVLRAWHRAWCTMHDADGELGPAPGWRQFGGRLRFDWWTHERPRWWLVWHEGMPVGWLQVTLPQTDNQHVAICEIGVVPDRRRQGIGKELVAIAVCHARAGGRRVLLGECSDRGAAPAFCSAIGAEPGVRSVRRLLHLDRIVPAEHERRLAEAWRHAEGYSLVSWSGPAPDAFVLQVASVQSSMNDAPMDDLDFGDQRWDVEHLRRLELSAAAMAQRLYQVAVRHDRNGELAGLTRVVVAEEHPTWGEQWETVVVPAHRGHRLGLIVKLEMIRQLRSSEPLLTTIETDNAASNSYMVAVNDALGYEPEDSLIAYQLRTG